MFFPFKKSTNEPRDKKSTDGDNLRRADFKSGNGIRPAQWGSILRWTALLMLVLGVSFGAKILLDRLVLKHPDFLLQGIIVETNGRLENRQIIEAAGVDDASNLYLIRIGKARERLEALPEVKSAEVVREIPGMLRIQVEEYEPVAWLSTVDGTARSHTSVHGVLLTRGKIAIPCRALHKDYINLPVIQVKDIAKVPIGYVIESPQVDQGIELVLLHEELMFEYQMLIKKIVFENRYGIKVGYGNDAKVLYSRSDLVDAISLRSQVRDFRSVMEYALREQRRLATLDLSVRKNLPATFFDNKSAVLGDHVERSRAVLEEEHNLPVARPVWRPADVSAILGSLY